MGPDAAPAAAADVTSVTPPTSATLHMPDGRVVSLPVLTDAVGAVFVDVRKLQPETGACARVWTARRLGSARRRDTPRHAGSTQGPRSRCNHSRAGAHAGICTFDPGFGSTASCTSAVRRRGRGPPGAARLHFQRHYLADDTHHIFCQTHARASPPAQVTHVDGERGQLLYRGYPIEQVAARSDMLDCIFLLLVRAHVASRACWMSQHACQLRVSCARQPRASAFHKHAAAGRAQALHVA